MNLNSFYIILLFCEHNRSVGRTYMIKIFSKLKLILTITVILITILFSILIYRQYTQFETSKETIDRDSISSLHRDTTMILYFYNSLAKTYYDESLKDNQALLDTLLYYSSPESTGDSSINQDFQAILAPIFHNAQNNYFSYIRVFDKNSNHITTISESTTANETNYSYRFSLYKNSEHLGYIELGLSVRAVIKTLEQTTYQATYALFKKSELTKKTLECYGQDYTTSNLSDQYYIDLEMMQELHSYTNNYEKVIFKDFNSSIKSIVFEKLLRNENFTINKSFNNHYYSLTFVVLDEDVNKEKGYFVLFNENAALTSLHDNLMISIGLLIGLYLTLLFIVAFIYYILHYLYHFSYTDHLTKAYNRHKFFEVIKHNIYDYHRYNYMFSVILIDIDNFKGINDTLGHNVGDEVLVKFVNIIESSLRTTDYLFRWGGEEFLVLLSHCDDSLGYQVAEKLRENIDIYDFNLKNSLTITASFGVASYKSSTNVELMISHADKALYASKSKGKNRTTLYAPDLD